MLRRTDERPDDRDGTESRGHRADHVEAAGTTRRLGDVATGEHEDGDADRDVDEQRPAPGADVGDEAADEQADGGAGRGDGTEQGERPVPRGLVGCAGGEQGQHARRGHGGADALEGAGDDQLARGLREPAEQGEEREDAQPELEHAEAAADVAEATAEQEEPAEGERVGVEHPGQRGRAEAEVGVDARERDVHHGDVQHQHELGHEHDRDPRRGATGVRRQLGREVPLSLGVASGQCRRHGVVFLVWPRDEEPMYSVTEKFSAWRKLYGDTLRLASEVDHARRCAAQPGAADRGRPRGLPRAGVRRLARRGGQARRRRRRDALPALPEPRRPDGRDHAELGRPGERRRRQGPRPRGRAARPAAVVVRDLRRADQHAQGRAGQDHQRDGRRVRRRS